MTRLIIVSGAAGDLRCYWTQQHDERDAIEEAKTRAIGDGITPRQAVVLAGSACIHHGPLTI